MLDINRYNQNKVRKTAGRPQPLTDQRKVNLSLLQFYSTLTCPPQGAVLGIKFYYIHNFTMSFKALYQLALLFPSTPDVAVGLGRN